MDRKTYNRFMLDIINDAGEGYIRIEQNTKKEMKGKSLIVWFICRLDGIKHRLYIGEADVLRNAKGIVTRLIKKASLFNHWGCQGMTTTDYGVLTPEKKIEWENREPPFTILDTRKL